MTGGQVSDGLLAELRRKMDDGTPRGMMWPTMANIALWLAPCVTTEEEVAVMNTTLMVLIADGDDQALNEIEIREILAELVDYYQNRNRDRNSSNKQ